MATVVDIFDFQVEVFLIYKLPDTSYQVLSQLAKGCKRISHLKQIADATQQTMDND